MNFNTIEELRENKWNLGLESAPKDGSEIEIAYFNEKYSAWEYDKVLWGLEECDPNLPPSMQFHPKSDKCWIRSESHYPDESLLSIFATHWRVFVPPSKEKSSE